MKEAAISLLSRAVELDQSKRYTEALLLYQEGIQMLLDLRKNEGSDKAAYYLKKIEEYMTRAENIKKIVNELKQQGKYHEQINITANTTGYSYQKVFGRFLDADVVSVVVHDPYIRAYHQIQNFIRFTEVLVKASKNLKTIKLITSGEGPEQNQLLSGFATDLKDNYNILLEVEFSPTLHDRQICLSNGWIIKIGRGLDYFKAPRSKHCIGIYDLDLRPCHETSIDIFHSNSVVNK